MVEKDDAREPTVGVDYDLTLVDGDGKPLPGAKAAMDALKKTGWKIIVWTARTDLPNVEETLRREKIPFDHVNENPEADAGEHSRKIFADAFVDDKGVEFTGDWGRVIAELERRRALWRLSGETKSKVRLMMMEKDGPVEIAVFGVKNGEAIEETWSRSRVVQEMVERGVRDDDGPVLPREGSRFLKALMGFQGTYLWAEIQ